ncbi:MAG TPA: type II toxin-antitoxin system RelE/ParE family toxin [Spirochaetia bacterium]|nr:type II toxin-antitoxin system RelE/ParE family toxin [Spirochaetia bacterium]
MARYDILIRPSVRKDVRNIPKADLQRIMERILKLQDDPRPPGCVRLSGLEYYRIRQGDYRIVYEIEDARLIVIIVRVGNRKDVYR